ncbi:MAG: hypothetical protein N2Z72_00590 [Bacteroidales bacterium]|nr:hypothetical protein [Bacteroidales bacterium]
MKDILNNRFLHIILLVFWGVLFVLFLFAFTSLDMLIDNFFIYHSNIYDLFLAISGSKWVTILLLIIIAFAIMLSWIFAWFKFKKSIHARTFLIPTIFSYLVTVLILFMLAIPFFTKRTKGAMQELIKHDTFYVKVYPMTQKHGFWSYPSVTFYQVDTSKKYAFLHYNFNLRGHSNVYVYQKYWSIVQHDTLYINPHPWIFERKIFQTNISFYLKKSTHLKFVNAYSMSWFMNQDLKKMYLDTTSMIMRLQ